MVKRHKFQGVWNIVRFNWHQYVLYAFFAVLLLLGGIFSSTSLRVILLLLFGLSLLQVLVTLVVSYYVYDYSDLYELKQVGDLNEMKVLNINAGFDETSEILENKFPGINLLKADFFNPKQHTEVSIKRARKAYPNGQDTVVVDSVSLPFLEGEFDKVICIFSAHEIRNQEERIAFLREIARVTKPSGEILIMEHLRDLPNFIAYNIGFLHFYSKNNWKACFDAAKLLFVKEVKSNEFVSTFKLKPYGPPN